MVLLGFVIDGYDLQLETVESCPEQFALRIIDVKLYGTLQCPI